MKTKRYSKKNSVKTEKGEFDHIQPVEAKPVEVKVYNNNFEKALKAFRALVQKERTLSLYKEKQSYEKPSDKNRRKRSESKRKKLELDEKPSFKNRERSSGRDSES